MMACLMFTYRQVVKNEGKIKRGKEGRKEGRKRGKKGKGKEKTRK